MTKEQLKEILESSLNNCTATVESDDNVHFSATIVERRVQRHEK